MRFSKYNHEGYHDPTVYEAFTGIEKERKQEKQAVKQLRASYAVYRPIVYICSPYAGDVKQNVRRAQAYCRRPDLGKAAAAIGDLQFSHDTCTS